MSNLSDWKKNPDKNQCQADGVYPGEFTPNIGFPSHGVSRLDFSFMYPCENPDRAKQSAAWYIERNYGTADIQFFTTVEMRRHNRFYALFIRRDR